MGANDFTYTNELFESILQIVSDIASIEYRDPTIFNKIQPYNLWKIGSPIVKCILIRAFYKGMHDDVKNLQSYAGIWHSRLERKEWEEILQRMFYKMPGLSINDIIEPFCFDDATIEGIDFNCSGMLQEIMKKKEIINELQKELKEDVESYLPIF